MYVIYPASQLVGLTVNFREINQVQPFPPRNPSEEPEPPCGSPDPPDPPQEEPPPELLNDGPTPETSDNQDRGSLTAAGHKAASESPPAARCLLPPVSAETTPLPSRSSKTLSLADNLRNLEAYREAKSPLKRSWSLHFKKAGNTTDLLNMAAVKCALQDMTHPALNETLKAHNAVTFKLVKTVSEFTESLAHIYEQHAEEMQLLVSNFRKKNSELRKERPACASSLFHTWETLLQEVEIDSQAHGDIASILGRQVSRPLLEKSFFRKLQSRKVFSHRESYDMLIKQNEEKLGKTRIEYKTAYLAYMNGPSTQALSNYINSHNEYVSQLHITNGMLSQYHSETLPLLLQELEDIYSDLCVTMSDSVLQGAEMISSRSQEQSRRYEGLTAQCRSVQGPTDLAHLVRSVTMPPNHPPARRHFAAPQPPQPHEGPDGQPLPVDPSMAANLPPQLKNEIVVDRLATIQVRERYDAAKKEALDLETQIKQLSDALHTLTRVQQRSVDSNLFNKVNEIQEDISAKQYELNLALLKLASAKAQKELFGSKVDSGESGRDRKMSSSSTGSMKSKWMKAFKSLKTSPTNGASGKEEKKNQMYHAVSAILAMRKNGKDSAVPLSADGSVHSFQDYTYKKITPCDVCSQVLRGHTRQGLKCRVCKLNVHVDCQDKAPKCQQKSRLLRRQKSTSEIDTKIQEPAQDEETPKPPTGARQVHYDLGPSPGGPTDLPPPPPSTNLTKSRTLSQSNLDSPEVDQVYQVLKQASDLSSKQGGSGRNLTPNDHYQPSAQNVSPPHARSEYHAEKTLSFDRDRSKSDYYHMSQKPQKGYYRTEYQTTPDFYQSADYYQHSPPKSCKNRLSDPGVSPPNNAACLGPSAGNVSAGGPCPDTGPQARRQQGPLLLRGNTSLSVGPVPHATSSGPKSLRTSKSTALLGLMDGSDYKPSTAPHSPRRQKLNLRMKSLSLDSPESTEQAQKRRAQASHSAGHSSQSSSSKIHSDEVPPRIRTLSRSKTSAAFTPWSTPSSPVHNRRLLSARNMRMSSVELPDDNEKSLSSASTSPCPSPKPHRLLPTNLYVVLYNFKSRHPDELDLKAGYKVTVMDNSDPDWWKGKCLGRVGYFPSKYVIKLEPGERPLQVTHNLQVQDGDNGLMLLRDQIVIQVGEDVDGMVMIRSADCKQGACPLKFLQEV